MQTIRRFNYSEQHCNGEICKLGTKRYQNGGEENKVPPANPRFFGRVTEVKRHAVLISENKLLVIEHSCHLITPLLWNLPSRNDGLSDCYWKHKKFLFSSKWPGHTAIHKILLRNSPF